MSRTSAILLKIAIALIAGSGLVPVARAQSAMKIVEEAGAWKVIIGGPLGLYGITQTDQAALGIVPADDGLYLYVNVPDAGLKTVAVQFDNGLTYTLPAQIASGVPTYRILVDSSQSVAFVHALTAGKSAKIVAGLNTYPLSLAGTSPAIDGFNFYGKEHDLHLPPPFSPAKPYGTAQLKTSAVTPASTAQAPSEWTKIGSHDSIDLYVDQMNVVRTGNTAAIWVLQDFKPYLQADGTESLRGPPGKQFRSVKFRVEYDCKSDLYRGLYYGTFTDQMGRGALADGGPTKSGDPAVNWLAVPADMEQERVIACALTQPTVAPAPHVASQSSDALPDFFQQWTNAMRSCSSHRTQLACSQYLEDSGECLSGATSASAILLLVRHALAQGETPQTAARYAAQTGHGDIAAMAAGVPATMTPREFSNRVMKDCLDSIAQKP